MEILKKIKETNANNKIDFSILFEKIFDGRNASLQENPIRIKISTYRSKIITKNKKK